MANVGNSEIDIEIIMEHQTGEIEKRAYVINFEVFIQYQRDNITAVRDILRIDQNGEIKTKLNGIDNSVHYKTKSNGAGPSDDQPMQDE